MKKKLLLVALLALGNEAVRAQSIPAGTVSLGGSIGYYRTSNKTSSNSGNTTYTQESTNSQFSFSPSVGYFVADNLAIGIAADYTATQNKYSFTPAPVAVRAELDPNTRLRLGLYGQYYKMITEQFGVLATLGGGYQNLHSYEYQGNVSGNVLVENKASGYYAQLTPGIVFFPIPKLGLSASIGSLEYDHLSYDYPKSTGGTAPSGYENKTSSFGAGFGLSQLLFGGTYYFGR